MRYKGSGSVVLYSGSESGSCNNKTGFRPLQYNTKVPDPESLVPGSGIRIPSLRSPNSAFLRFLIYVSTCPGVQNPNPESGFIKVPRIHRTAFISSLWNFPDKFLLKVSHASGYGKFLFHFLGNHNFIYAFPGKGTSRLRMRMGRSCRQRLSSQP